MVDNRDSLNNGHSPFRRYVPPTHQGQGTRDERVSPSAQTSPPRQGHRVVPSSSSRHRSPRNRWRQWVGGEAAKPSSPTSVAPTQLPQSSPTAPRRAFQLPPQPGVSPHSPPSPGTPPPSSFVKNSSPQLGRTPYYPNGDLSKQSPHPSVTPIS
ncbi:MAG: hypothetical protein AAGH78_17200, partial [Cyanobacteria bacterium P01_H01_bin.58]